MDWNGNGETTVFEYYEAGNIKTREVELGQQICKEFFTIKDGLPIKISCQLPASLRTELSGFRWKKIGNMSCREYFTLENMQIIEINCHPEVRKMEEVAAQKALPN
jgi:hypothetical protein